MEINGRKIGPENPPYIVAEISGNHNGSLDKAKELILAAKNAGADAVKFQCYTPDTITIDCDKPDFILKDGPWAGRRLHDLYKQAHTPFEWFPELARYAKEFGITWFSSVFDKTSVDLLETLGCPAYKIASMEITDLPLIRYAAATGKPIIISTGMADRAQIEAAAYAAVGNFVILHCVSGYPTPTSEANLNNLVGLREIFPLVGLSDHSTNRDISIAATALGACMIEAHLQLPKDTCLDSAFSRWTIDFKWLTSTIRIIWQAMHPVTTKPISEFPSYQLRRSLYVVKDVKEGEPFTKENVRSIRPGYGMAPRLLPDVLSCKAARDLERGTALEPEMLE